MTIVNREAVVLLNLGGPDSLEAVRPFLYNLFSDPDIFQFPFGWLTQKLFAALIAYRRAPEAAKGYAAIGGSSPLLKNTQAQAGALQQSLAQNSTSDNHTAISHASAAPDVFICMRYWHPRADQVVTELKQGGYTRVLLLPLYPQYSRTTTGSSFNDFVRTCERHHYHPTLRLIKQWYDQPDYQQAIADTLRAELAKFPEPDPMRVELLFSAHGLPQKVVDAGDPYEQHVRATYDALCANLGWPNTTLCFQSRVGPLTWLKPYTEDVIRIYAKRGVKQMLVYPIAFVSDHVETLFELGITYAELARKQGVTHYRVAKALNSHPRLIQGLTRLVTEELRQL